MKLYEIAHEHQQALELLASMEDLDPQTIEDSMAALNDELESKVLSCAKFLKGQEAEVKALKEAEQSIAARRKSLENQVAGFKEYVRLNMVKGELQKAKDNFISVSITKPREVCVIDDPKAIPELYTRVKVEPVKADILKALKDGYEVQGAHIEQGQPGLRIS